MAEECRRCDWECFRDPSELTGPLLDICRCPHRLLGKLFHDRQWLKTWLNDLRYYRDCNYFDGRLGPDSKKLEKWRQLTRQENLPLTLQPSGVRAESDTG